MPDAAWKAFEREVARMIRGQRQGGAPGHVWPDVISQRLVVECKYRAALPKWLKDALRQARLGRHTYGNRHKLPALAVKEKGMRGFIVIMHSEDWEEWFGEVELRALANG